MRPPRSPLWEAGATKLLSPPVAVVAAAGDSLRRKWARGRPRPGTGAFCWDFPRNSGKGGRQGDPPNTGGQPHPWPHEEGSLAPPLWFCVLGSPSPSLLRVSSQGAWVAQSVGWPTSAQVMVSRSVGSSPASGSVLAAREPGVCFRF